MEMIEFNNIFKEFCQFDFPKFKTLRDFAKLNLYLQQT